MIQKPLITLSGKRSLLTDELHERIVHDIPNEGVEWRRRLEANVKSVYVDIDFIEFDSSKHSSKSELNSEESLKSKQNVDESENDSNKHSDLSGTDTARALSPTHLGAELQVNLVINEDPEKSPNLSIRPHIPSSESTELINQRAFFNKKLLGQPILHTFWADKGDFELETKKSEFENWIGQVQGSNCTEWAIIIIEDGDFKAQIGTALFKSKLQSTTPQTSSTAINKAASLQTPVGSSVGGASSLLERAKKSLATMFSSDANSDRWLTLINQNQLSSKSSNEQSKANESYSQFIRKFRNLILASFSKQIELSEEQLRVQREIRNVKNWDFLNYFLMQEELACAFEYLTLYDEALMQYDLLDALFTEHLHDEPIAEQWTQFDYWYPLCLDLNNNHYQELKSRIVQRKASLLDVKNYLFAKQSDLKLLQNQPWRVASSTIAFLHNCIYEHQRLGINTPEGALHCWAFVSALEVLQKCECYSCTSTMENYSYHTVDIWNFARRKLINLGNLLHDKVADVEQRKQMIDNLIHGLGSDPHGGLSYQKNEISSQARLKDALAGKNQYSKHLIELSELTLGTYKHIGRKRHALLIGKELAEFHLSLSKTDLSEEQIKNRHQRALAFLLDIQRLLITERWTPLVDDIKRIIARCDYVQTESQ